jgi:formate/nitrite transporter FocA (FNT family)
MHKEFILFIKYPYTAGIIAIIWIASAVLMGISAKLPGVKIVIIDMIVTVVIAAIGFGGKAEA